MSVTVKRFRGDLCSLGPLIRTSLERLGEVPQKGIPMQLVGPIPVYAANAVRLVSGQGQPFRQTGWKGLVLSGETPIACVDIHDARGHTERKRLVSVRGADAAKALYAALAIAETRADRERQKYEARFVGIPRLFVTAVWMFAKTSFFVPTRTGSGPRKKPRVLTGSAFVRLVEKKLRRPGQGTRNAPDEPGMGSINTPLVLPAKKKAPAR
jgi:hypothetical protein